MLRSAQAGNSGVQEEQQQRTYRYVGGPEAYQRVWALQPAACGEHKRKASSPQLGVRQDLNDDISAKETELVNLQDAIEALEEVRPLNTHVALLNAGLFAA